MSNELAGRYQIISEIGRGGMATVYRAHDPDGDRDVAVKVLPQEYLNDLGFRARFEREAETISKLKHPAIVPLYEFGQHESRLYITMAYMPKGSLADLLASGPLTVEMAAKIVERVCAALDYAHNLGIIHRDLKPSNILFDQDWDAFLADFGIALQATAVRSAGGIISGTPAYMSPEQTRREGAIDGRSDLYALGINIFTMLTGQLPFEAETPVAIMLKQTEEAPPSPRAINPDLPEEVEAVLFTALAKDPANRYQTGAALSEALNQALGLDPPEWALWDQRAAPAAQTAPATQSAAATMRMAESRSAAGLPADLSTSVSPLPRSGPTADSAQEHETVRATAIRWFEDRPLAVTILMSLLGVLCAAVVVTAIRAPAFLSATDSEGAAESSSLSAIVQGEGLDNPSTPFSFPAATSTPRPNIRILYTGAALTVVNISAGSLSLDMVEFRRISEDDSAGEAAFSAQAWDNLPGQPKDILPAGGCFQLLIPDDLTAESEPEPILLPTCESPPGWLVAGDEDWIFWLPEDDGSEFEVLQDQELIHICPLNAGDCRFYLPQP